MKEERDFCFLADLLHPLLGNRGKPVFARRQNIKRRHDDRRHDIARHDDRQRIQRHVRRDLLHAQRVAHQKKDDRQLDEGRRHDGDEGDHPGRRLRDAYASAHPRGEQTAPPGLRQADDLLSLVYLDVIRN